ncbi:MAG: glycosyltransferase family 1 protein [Rikenellaceae bacterium]
MKVLYIYRHPDMGFSIGRVFAPIEEAMRQSCDVDSLYLPSASYSLAGLYRNIRAAKNRCKSQKYDIVHITGAEHYLLPFLTGENCVVTVHDIMYYSFLSGLKRWLWKFLFINSLKSAKRITFISEYSKHQLSEVMALNDNIMSVIPNSCSPDFEYIPKIFNFANPTILHVGTFERKNLQRTIEAIAPFRCHLRIVGNVGDDVVSKLKIYNIDYSVVNNLTDEDILREYEACDIVNFPSTFEGFGMPILEGQAMGRIVLTSNISPMKDICGEGAVLVDPFSVDSIREGYKQIIESEELRSDILVKGRQNVANYTIDLVANSYMNLYKSMLQA